MYKRQDDRQQVLHVSAVGQVNSQLAVIVNSVQAGSLLYQIPTYQHRIQVHLYLTPYPQLILGTSINQSINGGPSNKLLPQGPHRLTVIYETRPGYESGNRCSFSRFLKVSRDGAEVTSTGLVQRN